jgi:hypothetical protein
MVEDSLISFGGAFVVLFSILGFGLSLMAMYVWGWERRKKFEENCGLLSEVNAQVKHEREQRNKLA